MAITNEDGNLSNSPRVTMTRPYSDFDLSFNARTTSDGDVFKKTDAASVKQALKSLLLTNAFEKPYKPNYGGNLSGLLFEPADESTGEELTSRIKNAITQYEPRVKILNLKIVSQPNLNRIKVLLEFRVIATGIVDVLQLMLGAVEVCDPPYLKAPPPTPFVEDYILTENLLILQTESSLNLIFDDDEDLYPDD
jgi:phage baseplate assembly protein W